MHDAVAAYMEAFSTADLEAIPGWVAQAFAEDAVFESPDGTISGRNEIAGAVRVFRAPLPGAAARFLSGVDRVGSTLRWRWGYFQGEQCLMEGFAVAIVGDDQKIARLTTFGTPDPPDLA